MIQIRNRKPRWDEAPEWANYLAQDADGWWAWYMYEPELDEDTLCWEAELNTYKFVWPTRDGTCWRESLEASSSGDDVLE